MPLETMGKKQSILSPLL